MFPHEITPELALEPKHRAANFAVACSDLGTFAYDATNRIKSRTGGLNYDWSDRGTLTTDGERSFTWNRANELTADSQGGSFGYDANGWRMRKSRDGTLEYFVYNHAHQLMLRWNDTTQTETDFVYLGGKSLARIEGGQTTYIQPDYHGSPLFETGPNGSIARQPFYLGYGRTTADGRSKIPGYTGAAMDVTTGHTYLGARYLYHKRFTSPDPVGLDPTSPTGLNRYAYAADDPVNNVDPLGRCVKNSDPECNPPRILPQPPQNKPEVSRTVQELRNASDCSVLRSCSGRSNGRTTEVSNQDREGFTFTSVFTGDTKPTYTGVAAFGLGIVGQKKSGPSNDRVAFTPAALGLEATATWNAATIGYNFSNSQLSPASVSVLGGRAGLGVVAGFELRYTPPGKLELNISAGLGAAADFHIFDIGVQPGNIYGR